MQKFNVQKGYIEVYTLIYGGGQLHCCGRLMYSCVEIHKDIFVR